ncbi:Cu2+-exporting ATPase [Chitinivorax tropicus]|uniref:Cu2+-exporting ATPase n=1 Tax=Chitinivorax tropicus TaxID=714531 RepID=A0A840MUC3_9PROT|nr:heavy metal translocating P-type ATPase [Chitinivorax tropicus]MBB5020392.1 Cu2+-exporting ATPase [Chitinivorax tropicus]
MNYRTATSEPACFHCGLPVPEGSRFSIQLDQSAHPACCAGCQAVAQTIIDNGLGDYYRHRNIEAGKVEPLPDEVLQQIKLYDSPDIQRSFVHTESAHIREAALILEGITCAACVWLNETHLTRQPGVLSVDINYATHRARIRWDDRQTRLSHILQAITDIGYRAHPFDAERQERLAQKERKSALARLWIAGLSMMQVMMYAVPAYLANGDMTTNDEQLLRWASLALTIPTVIYSAIPFYRGTLNDLRARRVGMDVPVTLGVLIAFFASCWALWQGHGEVYFDSVSMFVFLLLGGRYLEFLARRKAGAAVDSLVKLIPAFAHALPDYPNNRQPQETVVANLTPGTILLVKPGETIPADGTILEGESGIDESLMSGESRAIAKQVGDHVVGGATNINSPLILRVDRVGQDSTLAAIVRLLDRAMSQKPRLAMLADRISAWFVAALLVVAAATYLAWHWIDPSRALWITIAVLVISCPCALSLATPAALAAATGALSRLGLLVTRGHALETLANATHFVFDKTGTLTFGRMKLRLIQPLASIDPPTLHQLAAALEQQSEHPIARALCEGIDDLPVVTDTLAETGQGIQGHIAGTPYRIGRAHYVAELVGHPLALSDAEQADSTPVYLGRAGQWLARFELGDAVRPDADQLIRSLTSQGKQCILLSGDAIQPVTELARQLGIPEAQGALTPQGKLDALSHLQQQGGVVAMIGDGVNDAPVLGAAQISIALGSGTDVARASADMILINDQLAALHQAIDIAKRCKQIVRQNLWWSLLYNLVALPAAMTGLITPWIASLGMAGSSLLVVSNALRLLSTRSRDDVH